VGSNPTFLTNLKDFMEYYRQCKFRQGETYTIAWIPEHGAKIGYSMVFEDSRDSGRWEVVEVSDSRIFKKDINRSDVFKSIKK
jgi:hypothetical protein